MEEAMSREVLYMEKEIETEYRKDKIQVVILYPANSISADEVRDYAIEAIGEA